MSETQNIIKQIENAYRSICNECEEIIYYPPQEYRESSVRIINASTILYNEALRLFRDNSEQGAKTKLSLSQIGEVMQKTRIIMQKTTIIGQKEKEIEQIFQNVKLNPHKFLILDEWNGEFIENLNI